MDKTDWGTKLKSWTARSGRLGGKDYDVGGGNGHIPPGWWIQYKSSKVFTKEQKNRWAKNDNSINYLRQGSYCRWKADDETDPAKRYTHDYKFYPSLKKDADIGDPSPTTIMYKFDMDPIPPSEAQNRIGIQIHPDGQCNDAVLGGTAGCIGIQTYQDCEDVYRVLTLYSGLKVKVILE